MTIPLPRRAAAEAVGTYALVTAGCGALIINAQTGDLGHLGIALTFGLVIAVMIASFGHLSGAHFNPAVTVAFALTGHFRWRAVPAYLAGQFSGALLAALTLRLLFGASLHHALTRPVAAPLQSFGLEVLLTATLMLVIMAVATDHRAHGTPAALAIGAAVALGALWGGPISGASMNPARSLAPALIAGLGEHQWLYGLAPLLGASLAAYLYQWLRAASASESAGEGK